MSWSYQDTMPDDVSKVRFYLGDTVSSDPLLTNEEIEFALSEAGSVRVAASICADRLAAQYARKADLTEGQLSIKYSQKYKQFREIATAVGNASRSILGALPTAGGILVADKQANEQDDSLVRPSFTVDLLDNADVGHLDTTQGTMSDELS
jgi:hypothetical protein